VVSVHRGKTAEAAASDIASPAESAGDDDRGQAAATLDNDRPNGADPAAEAASTEVADSEAEQAAGTTAVAPSGRRLVVKPIGMTEGETEVAVTEPSQLEWVSRHSRRRTAGDKVLTHAGAGRVVSMKLTDEEWTVDVDMLSGAAAGTRTTVDPTKVHDRMHLMGREHLDAAEQALKAGAALVASASKRARAKLPATLGEACKLFKTSLAHMSSAPPKAADGTSLEEPIASVRGRAAWQLAVASAHRKDWRMVVLAAEEFLAADFPGLKGNVPAAWKLKGQAHMAMKELEEAEEALSQPVLAKDAKAASLLAAAVSQRKSRDAKDKQAWGKALQSMGETGAMSEGRSRPKLSSAAAADFLAQTLADRRAMPAPGPSPGPASQSTSELDTAAVEAEAELLARRSDPDDGMGTWYLLGGVAVVGVVALAALAARRAFSG